MYHALKTVHNSHVERRPWTRSHTYNLRSLVVLLIATIALLGLPQTVRAATRTVCASACDHATLQSAIAAASTGDTITIEPGTYVESGQIVIARNLTITAANPANPPMIQPAQDTSDTNDGRGWWLVQSGITLNLSHVILDGSGQAVMEAIRSHGGGVIDHVTFRHIQHSDVYDQYDKLPGTGVFADSSGLTVQDSIFQNMGRIGLLACGTGANATFTRNTYTGKGATDRLDYAVWVGGGATATVTDNTITANTGGASNLTSAGVMVAGSSLICTGSGASSATVTGNAITGSAVGIGVGTSNSDTSNAAIHFNRMVGNSTGVRQAGSASVTVDAENNWWGCSTGPGQSGCDTVSGSVDADPWLTSPPTRTVCASGCAYPTLQAAIATASAGDTITIGPGTYVESGQIVIAKNLTITAADPANPPVIQPAQDTSDTNDGRGWWLVQSGVTLNLSHVILDGSGHAVMEAIRAHGGGVIDHVTFRNMEHPDAYDPYDHLPGTGVFADNAGLTVQDSVFQNMGRIGLLACGTGANATFTRNTYTGKGAADRLDYAVWVGSGAAATVTDNTITANTGSVLNLTSAGVQVAGSSLICTGSGASSATVTGNAITASAVGVGVGLGGNDASSAQIHFNRIVGNTIGAKQTGTGSVNAENNWWGCNAGPGQSGCETVTDSVDANPWLVLTVTSSNTAIKPDSTAAISADLTHNSAGVNTAVNGAIPNGTAVTFAATLGSMAPTSAKTTAGVAASGFTAGGSTGNAVVAAVVDGETVATTIAIRTCGPLEVPGATINADTTWSQACSPYTLSGNVIVVPGVTLTIEAGVEVQFETDKGLQVNGTLVVRGTASDPVIFTSNQTSPDAGDWQFISFTDNSSDATFDAEDNYTGGSILQHCQILYGGGGGATGAIQIASAAPFIDNCEIADSAQAGIRVENTSGLKISNSTVRNNRWGGIRVSGSGEISVEGSTIRNNDFSHVHGVDSPNGAGISISGGYATTIHNNIIDDNSNGGYCKDGGGISVSGGTVTITDNTITNNASVNNGGGISISSSTTTGTISGNTVQGNISASSCTQYGTGGGGINISDGTILINNNVIRENQANNCGDGGNGGGGVYVRGGTVTIANNTINDNLTQCSYSNYNGGAGVWIGNMWGGSGPSVTLANNTISGNTIQNRGSGAGLYIDCSTFTITDNTITNNRLNDNSYAATSGIRFQNSYNCEPTGSTFERNIITGNSGTNAQSRVIRIPNNYFSLSNNSIHDNNSPFTLW
ncbi:MAG: right-handed parallel beta-helix repeat-containing protein, partial [Caldilineaceae bacterium]|nr:right-handed parallel beta-helix repeat-containing protein [Caldilineaceae bacterium]